MEEAIQLIQEKVNSLQSCLDCKSWASTDSEYHVGLRKSFPQRINQLKKAITILKEK